ncbi:YtxH domain-containing protein [Microlunatus soli]|uniref:YtxH domain-containing protein n=1 Tax=Microlunatus soli TaxID=630515 RepID=A0A1H1N9C0_9ACTN|nr:YtxH domain-containing protein [Microlunatus soli]SDR94819.1 hypothetical protein SAMN04489812_0407 [Microlunatus soli]
MWGKILIGVAGGVIGYLLGARAGRERYDQIKGQVSRVWNDPRVQDTASQAADTVKDGAAHAASKAKDTASQAVHRASDRVPESKQEGTADQSYFTEEDGTPRAPEPDPDDSTVTSNGGRT